MFGMNTGGTVAVAVEGTMVRRLRNAVHNGVRFLEASFNPSLGWSDFNTNSSGRSTSWITAHVLVSAGTLLDETTRRDAISHLLADAGPRGVWGFSTATPPDADSTIHAIHALTLCGVQPHSGGLSFVLDHQGPSGGIRTYADEEDLRRYRSRRQDTSFDGWTAEHVCVTASLLDLASTGMIPPVVVDAANAFIRGRQQQAGEWDAYWWQGGHWATATIVDAWCRIAAPDVSRSLEAAVTWLVSTIRHDGSCLSATGDRDSCVLSTGLTARALATAIKIHRDEQLLRRMAEWLILRQSPDGAWRSATPILRIPPPDCVKPERHTWRNGRGVGSIAADERHLYTTAAVVRALRHIEMLQKA